jgi:hypothetical protein
MRQSKRLRGSAEEGDEQSRRGSWSDAALTSHSFLRTLERHRPTANFPKMGIAKYRPISPEPENRTVAQKGPLATCHSPLSTSISNRELTMRRASASRASAPQRTTRGICSPLSNRELLGLEILQLAENKHPRPVLIANFEPNHFVVFQTGHSK